MAQIRSLDYNCPADPEDFNRHLADVVQSGVKQGLEVENGSPGRITICRGVLLTREGVRVEETDDLVDHLDIPVNAGGLPRVDLVVATYEYLPSVPPSEAFYQIVQGTPAADPLPPLLPEHSYILATCRIEAGESDAYSEIVLHGPEWVFNAYLDADTTGPGTWRIRFGDRAAFRLVVDSSGDRAGLFLVPGDRSDDDEIDWGDPVASVNASGIDQVQALESRIDTLEYDIAEAFQEKTAYRQGVLVLGVLNETAESGATEIVLAPGHAVNFLPGELLWIRGLTSAEYNTVQSVDGDVITLAAPLQWAKAVNPGEGPWSVCAKVDILSRGIGSTPFADAVGDAVDFRDRMIGLRGMMRQFDFGSLENALDRLPGGSHDDQMHALIQPAGLLVIERAKAYRVVWGYRYAGLGKYPVGPLAAGSLNDWLLIHDGQWYLLFNPEHNLRASAYVAEQDVVVAGTVMAQAGEVLVHPVKARNEDPATIRGLAAYMLFLTYSSDLGGYA